MLPRRHILGFALLPSLVGCGDEVAPFQAAFQSYLDANRECLPVAALVHLPSGARFTRAEPVSYELIVPSYGADQYRIQLNRLRDQGVISIARQEESAVDSSVVARPVRFEMTVAVTASLAPHLDTDGRRICRAAQVAETVSLGALFQEQGETYRIGRFRIARSGPDLPTSPEDQKFEKLVMMLSPGASGADPNRFEVRFRVGEAKPVIVAVGLDATAPRVPPPATPPGRLEGNGAAASAGPKPSAVVSRPLADPAAIPAAPLPIPTDPAALARHIEESNRILEEQANQDPSLRKKLNEVKAFEKHQQDIASTPQPGQPSRAMVRQPDGTIRQGIVPGGRTVEQIQQDLQRLKAGQ